MLRSTTDFPLPLVDISTTPSVIKKTAIRYDISPELIAAIILQESANNPYAFRYEPAFYRTYVDRKKKHELIGYVPEKLPTLNTEKTARAFSWGQMQIMGQTAREQDYAENYLSMLLIPEHNIDVGAKLMRFNYDRDAERSLEQLSTFRIFKKYLASYLPADHKPWDDMPEAISRALKAEGSEAKLRKKFGLLRYNGGGNRQYPHEVWHRIETKQYEKVLK